MIAERINVRRLVPGDHLEVASGRFRTIKEVALDARGQTIRVTFADDTERRFVTNELVRVNAKVHHQLVSGPLGAAGCVNASEPDAEVEDTAPVRTRGRKRDYRPTKLKPVK